MYVGERDIWDGGVVCGLNTAGWVEVQWEKGTIANLANFVDWILLLL
jgi:hypothetical protein